MGIREHKRLSLQGKGISTVQAKHNMNKLKLYLVNVWNVPSDIAARVAIETMAGFNYRYNTCSISWAETRACDLCHGLRD